MNLNANVELSHEANAELEDRAEQQDFSSNISPSLLTRRRRRALGLGVSFGGKRNLYDTLGYPPELTAQDFKNKYDRQDIAQNIVDAPASTSWRQRPVIEDDTETEEGTQFEQAVEVLVDDLGLMHYWERADKVSGIGRFGILVLGLNDVGDASDGSAVKMEDPVDRAQMTGDPAEDIRYFATFAEPRVDIEIEDDPEHPRYGLPVEYLVRFSSGGTERRERVHHERVIHIAEGLLENEVYGKPRLEGVYNRLEDLEKVVGGASEMTWRGADRKFLANSTTDKNLTNADAMQQQIEDMIHGLEPVAYTRNVEMEVIDGETVDPTGLVDVLIKLISGQTGIPQRILTGSERGELASTQDRATFFGRMAERQEQFCEPQILRPTLDALVEYGIIPQPSGGSYSVDWGTLFELTDVEKAEIQAQEAKTIKDLAPMGDTGSLATIEELRENVLGWSAERGTELENPDAIENPSEVEGEPAPEETPEVVELFEDLRQNAGR